MAVLITRRLLRPLDHLAEAARNFGRTRQPVLIAQADLVEVEVIGQAMNKMQERIKRFLDERAHMIAAVSHDIRTGLTRVLLDAEELADDKPKGRVIEGLEEIERLISATLAFAGDDLKNEPVAEGRSCSSCSSAFATAFGAGELRCRATAGRNISPSDASLWRSSGRSPT